MMNATETLHADNLNAAILNELAHVEFSEGYGPIEVTATFGPMQAFLEVMTEEGHDGYTRIISQEAVIYDEDGSEVGEVDFQIQQLLLQMIVDKFAITE